MKKIIPLIFYSALSSANQQILVPFNDFDQAVVVSIKNSRCDTDGSTDSRLEPVTPNLEYKIHCRIRAADQKYDSFISILRIENFKYPKTIIDEIQQSNFSELLKNGSQPIQKKIYKWGVIYSWSTPTKGTMIYNYLCPKNSKRCFRVTYGGIENVGLEVRRFKK